jgi:SAM-dependent methyltransferase
MQHDPREFENLITLDINPDKKPDVVWDIENIPLPFEDGIFDQIHAYHVLEHSGRQGDAKFFFSQFQDFWRLLKHGGTFHAVVPHWQSEWAWGDPGHTRIFHPNYLWFLDQRHYGQCDSANSASSDYRYLYKGNFETIIVKEDAPAAYFGFILGANHELRESG